MPQSLAAAGSPESAQRQFTELRAALTRVPAGVAVTTIREFLNSKADAPSGAGFKIGANGFLEDAPSLRVFLLDYLARIDRTAAAEYARIILSRPNSADEWAVSLRNLALGDTGPEARAYLENKTGELLRYEPWQQHPSTGYLEAFDLSVYLGGTGFVATLSQLACRRDNPAVARAAYLALDRLVIQQPAEILTRLQNDPALLAARPLTRANYFARSDVADVRQKTILEAYLLDPERSAAELRSFGGLYPNVNYMISANLLTRAYTPTGDAIFRRDREALRVVNEWVANPRFQTIKTHLEEIRDRLASFVPLSTQAP